MGRPQMFAMSAGFFGVHFCSTLQIALVTPYFLHTLRASTQLSHFVWILGPISGMFTAPVVGYLSDGCSSRWGRRRPFILGGTVTALLALGLFGSATRVGLIIGASPIAVAIVAFGAVDFAANTLVWPLRAMISDLVGKDEQHLGQGMVSVQASLGEIASSIFLAKLDDPLEHMQRIVTVAIIILSTSVAVSIAVGRESPLQHHPLPDFSDKNSADEGPPGSTDQEAQDRDSSGELSETERIRECTIVAAIYGFGWLAWFCCLPYLSSWLGTSVLGGDPEAEAGSDLAERFQRGVELLGRFGIAKSVVGLVSAAVYPGVLRSMGLRPLLAFSYGLLCALFMMGWRAQSEFVAGMVIAGLGWPWSVTLSAPSAVILERYPQSRGALLGYLNLFAVVPQLLDATYTGTLVHATSEATLLFVASCWAGVAALTSACFLRS
mmetsp:Transcript_4649/g.9332  ORF Transcript_4649/g.9332 Transcript_4649/m.9332 type:complete len:437 (-) Transcript_4649:382-1692(-)